ncbi:MAG: hypothetical protein PF961_18425 [Planctomycetota bacterium]|jgi:hypothetical protein|nr:hypothetical protein [Planctomycetota bacterium]
MRTLCMLAIFALCLPSFAAESEKPYRKAEGDYHSHTHAEVTTTKKDGSTETYQVNRQDRVEVEKDGATTSWHRDSKVVRSDGVHKDVTADGQLTRDGEGGGEMHVTRRGDVTGKQGKERSKDSALDKRWKKNELGGHDTERVVSTATSGGESRVANTQRRSADVADDLTRFIQQTDVSSSKHGQSVKWETGQRKVNHFDKGYELRTDVVGWDDKGDRWTREHSRQVAKHPDGAIEVLDVTAVKYKNDQPHYAVLRGTYRPVGNADKGKAGNVRGHWTFTGTLEKRDGNRVLQTREIKRQVKRLQVAHPDEMKDQGKK